MKMNSPGLFLPLLLFILLHLSSCGKNDTVPVEHKNDASVEVTDSVKVFASTYLLDSLPTSNTGDILVGQANDAALGKFNLSSFLQMKPAANITVPTNSLFDSLTFVLKYNKYVYGDTTVTGNISIHRLNQKITLRKLNAGIDPEEKPVFVNGDALYSTSSIGYDLSPLGSLQFKPRPASGDSLSIRMSNLLGEEIFGMLQKRDKRVTSEADFLDYFKGIALRSNTGGSIEGFNADSVRMDVHYHFQDENGFLKRGVSKFSLQSKEYQFNHIDADRSATKLQKLNYKNREVSAVETNQELFVQAGTGIVTKIRLPGLKDFMNEPKIVVNKVELFIQTSPASYALYKAPEKLILYVANSANTPKSVLSDPYKKTIQQAVFSPGYQANDNGRYTFLLTEYADKIKSGEYKDTSLLLSLPTTDLLKSLTRLQITDYKSSLMMTLRITYTKY